ncbi:type I-E CRISPR-associated protein Cas7/Cse4/CasC [Halodesulfovibrio sp.]|jgi:CRISPR system Cascade subunit CasC|uniref:type I-E CRISPR-associated protein Cas7/Cse4/CasC n=1 Tax=Halodesulfovibrio sp. TaxID=1912772 RepID=UPI0025DA017A|nr:type I-E CRISPR-associated protein Cas7/Cse4/CasC [Halodesulfovibrio sp.]MCT4533713.1 type I-E CRISPR-associated protein Cas7/Cse4/CasC [Halodesulfovibrio sp.]
MSTFIQLHTLTSYPASNLNRDDLGRLKTVTMGNSTRLRVSSQSLKRAWRTSDVFQQSIGGGNLGIRTKELGKYAYYALVRGCTLAEALDGSEKGGLAVVKDAAAVKIAREIASVFGVVKKEDKKAEDKEKAKLTSLETEQLVHVTPQEIELVAACVESCRESSKVPAKDELDLLRKSNAAVDVAMFGRMLASSPQFNTDAAIQVAHAMTVHSVALDDDYFTAVDDLNKADSGAAHLGITEFGAGLFYNYICIDLNLLDVNLGEDVTLRNNALKGLLKAVLQVSPTGKQNCFASRAYASYVLAERGSEQPRNLSVAFLKGIAGTNVLTDAIKSMDDTRSKMNACYGMSPDTYVMNVELGEGTLEGLLDFITE